MDKHLKVVREVTWDVRSQWYNLGLELGISVGTLQVGGSLLCILHVPMVTVKNFISQIVVTLCSLS